MDENTKGRGKIYPCYNIEDQRIFLLDRSLKNGFELKDEDFKIVERAHPLLKKRGMKHVKLNKVVYEGKLKIKDREKFIKTLKEGIGREKAYGFGMMTVIPVM